MGSESGKEGPVMEFLDQATRVAELAGRAYWRGWDCSSRPAERAAFLDRYAGVLGIDGGAVPELDEELPFLAQAIEADDPAVYFMTLDLSGHVPRGLDVARLAKRKAFRTLVAVAARYPEQVFAAGILLVENLDAGLFDPVRRKIRIDAGLLDGAASAVDRWGHGLRWYVAFGKALGARSATYYEQLDGQLRRLGFAAPAPVDARGRTIEDYVAALRPTTCDYLAVDLTGADGVGRGALMGIAAPPPGGWPAEYRTRKLLLRRIPQGRQGREYFLGVYPLTCGQWRHVVGNAYAADDERPFRIEETARFGNGTPIQDFLEQLRRTTGMRTWDVPSRKQWEHACRAGAAPVDGVAPQGPGCPPLGGIVEPQPVGRERPNAWGFHDLRGDVAECTRDSGRKGAFIELPFSFLPMGGMPGDSVGFRVSLDVGL